MKFDTVGLYVTDSMEVGICASTNYAQPYLLNI